MNKTVAIMQPYFVPYAGYFRLMAATDLFVIYDCVQFPRRGWVHRNRLSDDNGTLQWLTLPLQKVGMDAKINELIFRPDAADAIEEALRRFPICRSDAFRNSGFRPIMNDILKTMPVETIVSLLQYCCLEMNIPFNAVRSSALGIDPACKGQNRIIAIARAVGATTYVNAPGGRHLYQSEVFEESGVALRFLRPWEGSLLSIMHELLIGKPNELGMSIRQQCALDT